MKRESSPSVLKTKKICDALGLEFYIGPPRITADSPILIKPEDDFVKVDRYLIDLSAGPGAVGDNAEQAAPLAFRADWMRDRNLNPKNCVVVSVAGDSMVPTLHDGDLVLVDRSKTVIESMKVYAFNDDGFARVKRLERVKDAIVIRSDSPSHETELRTKADEPHLNIIGRVMWSGHAF